MPNLNGFNLYPCCDSRNTPLNFVLQLYKAEFPEQVKDIEHRIPDCALQSANVDDFPDYDDYAENKPNIAEIFGKELDEYIMDNYGSAQRTKTGGYPSFTQSSKLSGLLLRKNKRILLSTFQ